MFGPTTPEMLQNWGWFFALGIALLLLGITVIVRSITTTVSVVFCGWLFVCGGFIEFPHAFMVGNWAGFYLHLLVAILFGVTGIVILLKPTMSAEAVTVVMSIFLLVGGLYQLISAIWTHLSGWGWHALNGVVAAILGGVLLAQWPISGLWAIGLFLGIDLIFCGWTWIRLALTLRKL